MEHLKCLTISLLITSKIKESHFELPIDVNFKISEQK